MNKKLLLIVLLAGTLNADALSNKIKKNIFRVTMHTIPTISMVYSISRFGFSYNIVTEAYAYLLAPIAATEYLADKWFGEEDENN